LIPQESASAYLNESFWNSGIPERITECNPIDYFQARQQIFDQMLQFGQICMIIGFVIGLAAPALGRYVKVKYGWFTK
jgi:hypothetical protein